MNDPAAGSFKRAFAEMSDATVRRDAEDWRAVPETVYVPLGTIWLRDAAWMSCGFLAGVLFGRKVTR